MIANLIGKNPLILLSGIGALSAVFMLVFKDSLLGLVAGIQLSTNDMVQVGDWIEMPKYGADGDIIDISLNTVKVQNFDKTITMIPSYALISDSFINWRGMQNSGDDGSSVIIYRYKYYFILYRGNDYEIYKMSTILRTISSIENMKLQSTIRETKYQSNPVNGRALTNIGVFRAYISNYLQNHPGINQEMTLMVRHS